MAIKGKRCDNQRSVILALDHGDTIANQKTLNILNIQEEMGMSEGTDKMKTTLDRPIFHQQSFNDAYQLERPPQKSGLNRANDYIKSKCSCDRKSAWKFLQRRIPVLDWLVHYDIKANIVPDLLGGITVGIMQIPQGMAYAILAEMPPVMGLYVSLFSVLVYFLLGTSRHLSLGTFAIICLMTGNIVDSYMANHHLNDTTTTIIETSSTTNYFVNGTTTDGNYTPTTATPPEYDETTVIKVQVATITAFTVGILQLGMGILQLGSLSVYLSETLVSGFTTGAAVLVFTSQVKYVLGISIPNHSGIWGIVYTYMDVFSQIQNTNLVTLALSVSVIVTLVVVNDCINLRFKGRMIMPIPTELLVIIATTLASYYLNLHDNFSVVVVGNIPTGIPAPRPPQFQLMGDVIVGSVAIAIVSYCIPISLAKIYAKKHKHDVDPNQELFAYGAGNVVGGFFLCFPSCGSLSRSSVQEGSGAKTQVASLVSCILIIVVLLFIAPLFEPVPNCVLAGIIMVALRGMFRQCGDLIKAWHFSKSEAAIWFVTFASVVFLDVDYGLIVSVAFILIVLLYKLQRPYSTLLGNIPTTDEYLDLQKYKVPKEVKGLKIVHFGGPLYFANREYFRRTIYKLVFNPQEEMNRRKKQEKKIRKDDANSTISSLDLVETSKRDHDIILPFHENGDAEIVLSASDVFEERENDGPRQLPPPASADTIAAIIVDCTAVSFIDSAALSILNQLIGEFDEVGVKMCLSGCRDNLLEKLEKADVWPHIEGNIFPTTHDAVLHIVRIKSSLPTISAAVSTMTVSTTASTIPPSSSQPQPSGSSNGPEFPTHL
ncbi:hypothetical protein CHUAL_005217 [Chamberlinius hualienensis]